MTPKFELIGLQGAHPQNVTFGYDVGKINVGCLVYIHICSFLLQSKADVHMLTVLKFLGVTILQWSNFGNVY